MGKATPDILRKEIRNALGNVVYYPAYGQILTRARIQPLNTATPARTRVRASLRDIAAIWQNDLAPYERDAWRKAAGSATSNPHRYGPQRLTGWQFFHRVNLVLQNIGLSAVLDPPAAQDPDPPTSVTVNTLDATTQTITLDVTGATGPNTHLCVYATNNRLSSQFSANGTTRFIQAFPPDAARPLDISAAWTSKFSTLQGSRRVNFQVCSANELDGSLSPRLYATALSTGTADAMQLIASQTLAAAQATVTFSAIPQTYKHLLLIALARSTNASTRDDLAMRFNADVAANYDRSWGNFGGISSINNTQNADTQLRFMWADAANATAAHATGTRTLIWRYAQTNWQKITRTEYTTFSIANSTADYIGQNLTGHWRSAQAITQIDIFAPSGANIEAGSSFDLYGLS